jgi:2-succinyl-6-hydroxy-2,4-cyclohexadiene-1-carboxylate synthase
VSEADPPPKLHADTAGAGPRLVLVHGFTQNRNCWGPLAAALAADHEVVRVDAPGHGRSSAVGAGLWDGAGLIAERGGPATYVGYSMGARFALHVALRRPEFVRGLVLIGGTGGIDDERARADRVAADEALAERLEHDGVEAFLDAWLALPLFAGLAPDVQFRAERRENTVDGLAGSLRWAGTGAQDPLWDRLGDLAMPVLAMAGGRDEKFTAEARRMVDAIGATATLAVVPDAGHAAHLEQPDAAVATIRPWLADHGL